MKNPKDAKKAAWCLQTVATTFYVVFAVVMYVYMGNDILSPAYSSLPVVWAKAAWGLALPNLLIAGALYNHTAAKIIFIRMFRGSRRLHDHTILGWTVWIFLVLLATGAAFVLAIGVPIFAYPIGIAAALFASWYTYSLARVFWLFDTYHLREGSSALKRHMFMTIVNILTILAGAFICVARLYAIVTAIVDAYDGHPIGSPFSC